MRYGTPEYQALYEQTPLARRLAAERWYEELMEHIKKQHPHLNNREEQWAEWSKK